MFLFTVANNIPPRIREIPQNVLVDGAFSPSISIPKTVVNTSVKELVKGDAIDRSKLSKISFMIQIPASPMDL